MFGINWISCKYRLEPEYAKKKNKENKIWRGNNKEQVAAANSKNYQENKEHYKEYNARYHEENFETIQKQTKEYRSKPEIKTRENKRKSEMTRKKTIELKQKIAFVNDRPMECLGYPSYGSCTPDGTAESRMDRLVFDHIHGGGSKDRAGDGLQWLRNQLKLSNDKLRKKLQLLCSGCNQEKIRAQSRKKITDL